MGILPLNENKTDEMVSIMEHVQSNYIPFQEYTEDYTLHTGEVASVVKGMHHQVLFGGDQLTVARMRSSQKARMNCENPAEQLRGVVPTAEDWHIKANFLGVCLLASASSKRPLFQPSFHKLISNT